MEKNINDLLDSYDPNSWTPILQNKYEKMKKEMEGWYSNATKASMFYNKVKWQMLGEKNTRYFYGLEKQRYNNSGINAIYNEKKR